jgi:predicted TIM-barrel fold metal-dependent hydrolase
MTDAATAAPPNLHLPLRAEWLRRRVEAPLDPALPIVDPHHHLWDGSRPRYLLHDLLEDLDQGHNVVATVFAECRSMWRAEGPEAMRPLGETEFVAGVAAMAESGTYGPRRICAGIVGHADLRLGEAVRPVLEAQIRIANGRFRGIRHSAAWDASPGSQSTSVQAPPGLLAEPVFRRGFAELAPLGLSYDTWLYHPQIPELEDLARQFPDTAIVLDHVGGPLGIGPYAGRRDAVFADWRRSIRALAACPNVVVKLGGLGMRVGGFGLHEQAEPPSSEALASLFRPYMDTCIEAFGPRRCMFESNFPVDKASCGYGVLWNAFKRLAADHTTEDRMALFSGTAARVYRLPLPELAA